MEGKILKITEKVPEKTTLPDGSYSGTWGGNIIEVRFNDKIYELETSEGVRGFGYHVVVNIVDGVATFKSLKN